MVDGVAAGKASTAKTVREVNEEMEVEQSDKKRTTSICDKFLSSPSVFIGDPVSLFVKKIITH